MLRAVKQLVQVQLRGRDGLAQAKLLGDARVDFTKMSEHAAVPLDAAGRSGRVAAVIFRDDLEFAGVVQL